MRSKCTFHRIKFKNQLAISWQSPAILKTELQLVTKRFLFLILSVSYHNF